MRWRFLAGLFVAAVLSGTAAAHDLWIDLDRWSSEETALEVDAKFLVGHAADQSAWALKRERVVSFVSMGPDGAADNLRPLLRFGDHAGAALDLAGEGIHLVAFESNGAYSDLPAGKFNDYVKEEGLREVAMVRKKAKSENDPGREVYSRRAKALIKLGDSAGSLPRPLGQTLEIVPLDNPFGLGKGEPMRVRIDYEGTPLSDATVSIESLGVGLLPKQRKKTGGDGVAAFAFPHSGAWKINVVWSEPLKERNPQFPEAQFETVFSSLTFGYP